MGGSVNNIIFNFGISFFFLEFNSSVLFLDHNTETNIIYLWSIFFAFLSLLDSAVNFCYLTWIRTACLKESVLYIMESVNSKKALISYDFSNVWSLVLHYITLFFLFLLIIIIFIINDLLMKSDNWYQFVMIIGLLLKDSCLLLNIIFFFLSKFIFASVLTTYH